VEVVKVITGSIARSAKHRYVSYSYADFEGFRPAGATRCTDGREIWHGEVDLRSGPKIHSSMPNFTPIVATIRVYDPKSENITEI